jgi:site-specific recombinase XerD
MTLTTPQGIGLTSYTPGEAFLIAGQVANQQAPYQELNDYRQRKTAQTLRRQTADIARFADYVDALAAQTQPHDTALAANLWESRDALQQFAHNLRDTKADLDLNAWTGLTYGHLLQFRQWLLEQGYSLRTVNFSLSTLRTYATFAGLAGVIEPEQMALIKATSGYSTKEFTWIDEKRDVDRRGYKKQKAMLLSPEQAEQLKHQQSLSVPQVRRDNLLMCLLLVMDYVPPKPLH